MPLDEVPHLELTHLRVAVAPTFPGLPVAAETRSAIEGLAQQLRPLCVAVEEATLPAVDFNQELPRAGALIGMITGAFQPDEQEQPTCHGYFVYLFQNQEVNDHTENLITICLIHER